MSQFHAAYGRAVPGIARSASSPRSSGPHSERALRSISADSARSGTPPMTSCHAENARMRGALPSRLSRRFAAAKLTEDPSATSAPGSAASDGDATSSTPADPSTSASVFARVMRSPRSTAARATTKSG